MSRPRKVTTKREGYQFEWCSTPGDRTCVDVDVYKDGNLVLQWRYGKVCGSSLLGNAAFWTDQALLQAKSQPHKSGETAVTEDQKTKVKEDATSLLE